MANGGAHHQGNLSGEYKIFADGRAIAEDGLDFRHFGTLPISPIAGPVLLLDRRDSDRI